MSDTFTALQSLPEGPAAAIESIIQRSAIDNAKVSVENTVPKGQNYTGVIYGVTVSGEKDGQDVTMTYIVKLASANESVRSDIPITSAYEREVMYYTELFPIYQRMQDEAGIPVEDQFRFAKCYHAGKEYLKEFLIFEDLKPHGFVNLHRQLEVDFEHARRTLEAYGKLHALSFALKKREPEKFEYFIRNVTEVLYTKDSPFTNMTSYACSRAITGLQNINYKECLERVQRDIVARLFDTLTQDEFSVLSHSDCWAGNMMYRYENARPIETCLIDFQICRYGAPTLDFMHYVFSNTGHKLRKESYEDLLLIYHNAIRNHLKALSYDIEQIYPWTRFKEDLKKSSIFGLVAGLTVAMVTCSDESLIPDLSDFADFSNSALFKSEVSDIYNERVNEIIQDFVSFGYIS